ncbi:hypothetical protein Aduo_000474 [Ancylostoma duodenale]
MHLVLGPLLNDEVFCYLDDIMIATSTLEKHLQMLEKVFSALSKARLKLNPRKCVLVETKAQFLGHVIDQKGLHMDPHKVAAITDYPEPTSRSAMRTFLGMCSYYRKFILGFSKIAGPLHEMTSEKCPYQWTSERKKAFQTLKEAITTAPVLAQPDIEAARCGQKPFQVHTDASYLGGSRRCIRNEKVSHVRLRARSGTLHRSPTPQSTLRKNKCLRTDTALGVGTPKV